jgi:uncharacterized membrane protein
MPEATRPNESERRWTWIGAGVVLAGCALRFWDLGGKSLWFDEALSIDDSRSLEVKFGSGYHPPLFYYLLHAWMRAFGDGEVAVRLVAAIPGAATVALVWLAARRMFGARAGAFAAAVIASASLHVEYSQEVRMYALATCFAALAALCLAELLAREPAAGARERWAWAAAYTAAAYLALATHYLTVLVFAGQAVGLLVAWPETRRVVARLAALQAPAVAAAALVLLVSGYARKAGVAADFLVNLGGVNQTIFSDLGARAARLPVALATEVLPGPSLKWLVVASYRWPAVALYVAAALAAFVALARRGEVARAARAVVLGAALLPLPVTILMMGPEQLRFYIAVTPFLALAIGAGLDAVRPRWAGAVALAAVLVVSLAAVSWYFDPGMDKQPWRRVGRVLAEQTRPGDVVLVNEPHLVIALERYFAPAPGVGLDPYPEDGGMRITAGDLDRWLLPLVRGRSRVWFVRMGATASHSDPQALGLRWLTENMRLVSRVREPGYNGDVELYLFER